MAAQLTGFMLSGPTLSLSPPAAGASMQPGALHKGGQLQAGAGFSIWLGQAQATAASASSPLKAEGQSLPQDGTQLPPFPVKNGKGLEAGDANEKGRESSSATPGWLISSSSLKPDPGESGADIAEASENAQLLSGVSADNAALLTRQESDAELAASERDALSTALMRLLDLLTDESWQLEGGGSQVVTDMPAREKLEELLASLRTLLEGMEGDSGLRDEAKGIDPDLLQALFKDFDTRELQRELTAEQLSRIDVALQQLQQALQQALQAQPAQADMIADGRMLAREALEKVLELLSDRLAQLKERSDAAREAGAGRAVASFDAQADRLQETLAQTQAQAKNAADTTKADGVPINPLGLQSDKKNADNDLRPQASVVSRSPESSQSASVPPPLHERQAPLPTAFEQQNSDRFRAPIADQLLPQERSIDQKPFGEVLKQADPSQQSVRQEAGLTTTSAQSAMAANSVPADATTAAKQAALAQQLQNPAWTRALGERAIMMTQQGPRFAEIRLDPPELGALKIRVHILPGDQVSISFNSPNAAVRDALEQNMPRLKEMFAEQGLNLMDSSVSDQAQEDRTRQNAQRSGDYRSGDEGDDTLDQGGQTGRRVGLVDYYA